MSHRERFLKAIDIKELDMVPVTEEAYPSYDAGFEQFKQLKGQGFEFTSLTIIRYCSFMSNADYYS